MSDVKAFATVALFTYCRLDHTRRTVAALQENAFAGDSELIVYSDAARTPSMSQAVEEVREFIATVSGFRSVEVRRRPNNYGLAKSIVAGVTEVLQQTDRIIVLEDDMVTSPHFLTFMNSALDKYADVDRVISIHGYMYPVEQQLPETFFVRGADCWGWATWRRGWAHFNPDGTYLLNELRRRKLTRAFDFDDNFPFSAMLEDQIEGKNDSWAILWHASAFLADKLTLYPGRSLVENVGNDASGTHCTLTNRFSVEQAQIAIDIRSIAIEPSREGLMAFEMFFRAGQTSRQRIVRKVFAWPLMKSVKLYAKSVLPPPMFQWLRKVILGDG